MVVLYNGRKQEYDITQAMNWPQILEGVEYRKSYVGQRVGDFEIVSAEYDWGLRRQVNVVRCVHCGSEKGIRNLNAFVRGKGEGQICPCQRKPKKKREVSEKVDSSSYVGKTISGFSVLSYQAGKGFYVECTECGKKKWAGIKETIEGCVNCTHRITNDYSDPKYEGMRVGSLIAVRREGGRKFRFRCDCGKEVVRPAGEVFRENGTRSCGEPECRYHRIALRGGKNKRERGLAFEHECATEMKKQGYVVEMTPGTGDYGVDFFAVIEGERVAFQCKKLKAESMIGAVQEVYAGGRYYDCCKFVVVSPSGFTYPAEIMAAKLGVQLERNLENFKLKSMEENKIDTQKMTTYSGRALIWEIDGVSKPAQAWCDEYGVSKQAVRDRVRRGMDLKTALTAPRYEHTAHAVVVEIDGVVKSKRAWCNEYGISTQLYDYRTKQGGLSPLEALTRPKMTSKEA